MLRLRCFAFTFCVCSIAVFLTAAFSAGFSPRDTEDAGEKAYGNPSVISYVLGEENGGDGGSGISDEYSGISESISEIIGESGMEIEAEMQETQNENSKYYVSSEYYDENGYLEDMGGEDRGYISGKYVHDKYTHEEYLSLNGPRGECPNEKDAGKEGTGKEEEYFLTLDEIHRMKRIGFIDKIIGLAIFSKVGRKDMDEILDMTEQGITMKEKERLCFLLSKNLGPKDIKRLERIFIKYKGYSPIEGY